MSVDHPTVSVEIDFDTDLSAGVGYHEQVAVSAPYVHYRLKETSGTFADASGNGKTGTGAGTITYNQTPSPVTGDATNRFVIFTTDTTRIGLTGVVPSSGQLTVEAFIYVTSLAVDRFIFENDGLTALNSLLEFWVETDGALSARAGNGTSTITSSTGQILVDTWYHVAAVFDAPARQIKFYKNGSLIHTGTWNTSRGASPSMSSLNTAWHWGTDSSSSRGSVARLAEPAVYLRVPTAAEFTDHYAALTITPFAGYTWTDVTDKVMFGDGLRRSFGRASELDDVVPMQTEFVLRNDDRRFEPEYGSSGSLTVSGNEITDASRAVGTAGDGLSADSSFGIWEATTNLVTNGGFETNATGWNAVSATVNRITSQDKFGAASGEIVTSNATANEGAYHNFTATVAVYTVSAWVRGAGGGTVRMAVRDNTGANPQTGTAVTLSSTWQRISLTTTNLTAATWRVYVETDVQQSKTFQIDGVQAELQPLATPYVETDGATATRTGAIVEGPATAIDETQAWVALRLRMGFAATDAPHGAGIGVRTFSWGASSSDRILGFYNVTDDAWQLLRNATGGAASESVIESTDETFAAGDERTVIFAWDATRIRISGQGRPFTNSAASVDIPTIASTTFGIGRATYESLNQVNADVLWFACGTGALTDADAATIHAFGDTDPVALPGNPTLIWHASTAAWFTGSPHFPLVVPGRPTRVRMTQNAVTYDWAFGFIEDFPQHWDRAVKFCRVPIRATCFLERLNEEDIGARDFVEQAAGARLTVLLNAAGHPLSMRDLDTGANTLMALTADTQTVGVHAKAIARTDRGLFYLDQRGYATFHDGNHRTTDSRSTSSQGTLGSTGSEIPYSSPAFHAPRDRIRNEITLRRPGGIDQTVTDQTSRNRYGKRSFSDEILLTTDAAVATRAAALLTSFKEPHRRIREITFNPGQGSGFWEHALGVQLSDRYTWKFEPAQGSTVSTAVFVEGVDDEYRDRVYTSRWFLSVVP